LYKTVVLLHKLTPYSRSYLDSEEVKTLHCKNCSFYYKISHLIGWQEGEDIDSSISWSYLHVWRGDEDIALYKMVVSVTQSHALLQNFSVLPEWRGGEDVALKNTFEFK